MATHLGILERLAVLERIVLDSIAPRACVVCGVNGGWLCSAHHTAFNREREELVQYIEGIPVVSLSSYEKPVTAALVQSAKYLGCWEAYSVTQGSWPAFLYGSAAVLVPIPIHTSRLMSRSYNQAAELARVIAQDCALPVNACMRRHDRSVSKVGQSKSERSQSQPQFSCRRTARTNSIILVDDVVTTGSTLAAAITACRQSGYRVAAALTLAQAPKNLPTAG